MAVHSVAADASEKSAFLISPLSSFAVVWFILPPLVCVCIKVRKPSGVIMPEPVRNRRNILLRIRLRCKTCSCCLSLSFRSDFESHRHRFRRSQPYVQRLAPGEDCRQGSSERWVPVTRFSYRWKGRGSGRRRERPPRPAP